VADAVTILLSEDDLNTDQQNIISEMISEQDVEPLLKAANTQGEERTKSRQELIHMLMDRHGTGRLLFRNT
ncbi:hypothetical protein Q2372_26600, partial [Escherichia coli]|nr:hypothetical protein [Escherichia coli]